MRATSKLQLSLRDIFAKHSLINKLLDIFIYTPSTSLNTHPFCVCSRTYFTPTLYVFVQAPISHPPFLCLFKHLFHTHPFCVCSSTYFTPTLYVFVQAPISHPPFLCLFKHLFHTHLFCVYSSTYFTPTLSVFVQAPISHPPFLCLFKHLFHTHFLPFSIFANVIRSSISVLHPDQCTI